MYKLEKIYCIGCGKETLGDAVGIGGVELWVCENPFCLRYKLLSIDYHSFKQMKLAQAGKGD